MKPTTGAQLTNHNRTFRPSRKGLLIALLLVLVVLTMTAGLCDDDDDEPTTGGTSHLAKQEKQDPSAEKKLELKLLRGTTGRLGAVGYHNGLPHPTKMKLVWNPPPGATNFDFGDPDEFPQPESDGPPWVWNLPVDPSSGTAPLVSVDYDPPTGVNSVADTFTLIGDGQVTSQSSTTFPGETSSIEERSRSAAPTSSAPVVQKQHAASAGATLPLQDDYYLWKVSLIYYFTEDISMTTAVCQDCVDLFQSEDTFFALRFPVQPPTLAYTDPYTLPVVFRGPYSPTLEVEGADIEIPLEYRPQYHTFLETELPSALGEHWLALGAATTPTFTCPDGLAVTKDWFNVDLYLDLGGEQDTCAGCNLPLYYCYRSPELAAMAQALGADADVTSYQGWGITCLGPHPVTLDGGGQSFTLHDQHTGYVSPTQTIAFSHYVDKNSNSPVTITLDYASSLGLPWGIYSDSLGTELLPDPIVLGPWYDSRRFYLIATVPADTPDGSETLTITATDVASPTLPAWTSDLLWVGDWVDPPGPPLWHRLYLPLVLRQSP